MSAPVTARRPVPVGATPPSAGEPPLRRRVTHVRDLADVLEQVARLHDRCAVPTSAHARSLAARADATGRSVTAVVVEETGEGGTRTGPQARRTARAEVVAVALLDVTTRWTPAGTLASVRLAGHRWADEGRLAAVDTAAADALAGAVLDLLGQHRAWRLRLEQLPVGDAVLTRLAAALGADVRDGDPLPQIIWPAVRDERTWARKKARQNARRAERAADLTGEPWSVDVLHAPHEVRAALPETREVRRARELALTRADALADPAQAAALDAVVATLGDRVQLWRLRHGGRLAAYLLASLDGDRVRLLDHRIRPGTEPLSPSSILFGRALRSWHDAGLDGVDLGRGRTPFKRRFATEEVATTTLTAWSHPVLDRAGSAASAAAERLRARLRAARDASVPARRVVTAVRRAQSAGRAHRSGVLGRRVAPEGGSAGDR